MLTSSLCPVSAAPLNELIF